MACSFQIRSSFAASSAESASRGLFERDMAGLDLKKYLGWEAGADGEVWVRKDQPHAEQAASRIHNGVDHPDLSGDFLQSQCRDIDKDLVCGRDFSNPLALEKSIDMQRLEIDEVDNLVNTPDCFTGFLVNAKDVTIKGRAEGFILQNGLRSQGFDFCDLAVDGFLASGLFADDRISSQFLAV